MQKKKDNKLEARKESLKCVRNWQPQKQEKIYMYIYLEERFLSPTEIEKGDQSDYN